MSWHITINLKSNQVITILNLVAINHVYNDYEPIDVFVVKDFAQYRLPSAAQKLAFLGDSDITLSLTDISQIKLSKK